MKKIFICLLLIVALVIASAKDQSNLPTLTVSANQVEEEATHCGYRLMHKDHLFQKTVSIADCIRINEVVNQIEEVKVSRNTAVELSFDETMDQLVILDWQQDVKLKTSNVLIAPEELGTYVYVVTAYWGENEATYVIKLLVE